jgi:hypothetical protein
MHAPKNTETGETVESQDQTHTSCSIRPIRKYLFEKKKKFLTNTKNYGTSTLAIFSHKHWTKCFYLSFHQPVFWMYLLKRCKIFCEISNHLFDGHENNMPLRCNENTSSNSLFLHTLHIGYASNFQSSKFSHSHPTSSL